MRPLRGLQETRASGEPGVSGDFWGSQEGCQGPSRPSGPQGHLPDSGELARGLSHATWPDPPGRAETGFHEGEGPSRVEREADPGVLQVSVAGGGVPTGTPKGLHRAVVAAGGPLGLLGVCQSYCGWGWCPLGLPRSPIRTEAQVWTLPEPKSSSVHSDPGQQKLLECVSKISWGHHCSPLTPTAYPQGLSDHHWTGASAPPSINRLHRIPRLSEAPWEVP